MPEPKRPLKVFLCHTHTDRDSVQTLYSRLTQDGVDAWLDKAKLLPGQDWELEIRKAVREADVVVVCLSKQFNQAGFRQKEVRLALDTAMEKPEGEIFIIPARLEECDNLESLRKWHWVDLFEEDGYEMLIRALRARADRIGATFQLKKSWLSDIPPFLHSTQKSNLNAPNTSQVEQHEPEIEIKRPGQKLTLKNFFSKTMLVFWGVFVFSAVVLSFGLPSIWKIGMASETQESTLTPSVTEASPNSTATPIQEAAAISTLTTLPAEIADVKGVPMVLVSAGKFIMGSNDGHDDEKPAHQVYLGDFYMDKYEVTNALYRECVDAGGCVPPQSVSSSTSPVYYGNSEFDHYPVIYVDWSQANTYCGWRNAHLPTEAEWEKSARGTDERTYPWGEGIDCSKANYIDCKNDTVKIGSYESGKSSYGIYDLAGNVWEWTADFYLPSYYHSSPLENPVGPASGERRVFRGGAWVSVEDKGRISYRNWHYPTFTSNTLGFRCADTP